MKTAYESKNVDLYSITGRIVLDVPSESDVEQMGANLLHSWYRDSGWLEDTKEALERIKEHAEKLEVEEKTANAELKQSITEIAKDALITHI